MTKLFKYYQKIGGNEEWHPERADTDLTKISPTFVTVLSLDTLLDDSPSREVLDAVKYEGPLYFDLDAEDINDSIAGGKALLKKLRDNGLTDNDFDIFLSGKKGLHFLIPMACFAEKPAPMVKLPAIYKELAFKLAVDTVDFRVYTARKGRMLRTCFNIRENGNYRVPVTAGELESLTAEAYDALCKAPRTVKPSTPTYSPQFGMLFEVACQKIAQIKKRKAKVVDAAELRRQTPVVQQILKGEGLADIGFNKLAIQLAVYARESNWTEDQLVEAANPLCNKHQSDGRYNTPRRREAELRRMYAYITDNQAYEYDAGMLKSCLQRETVSVPVTDDDGTEVEGEYYEAPAFTGGVQRRPFGYVASRNDEEVVISNFVLRPAMVLKDPKTGQIVSLDCQTQTGIKFTAEPRDFTSSSALQNRLGPSGHSFTGTDTHARGIYSIMLREAKDHAYVVDSEGMNLLKVPAHPNRKLAETSFLAWADRDRVVVPQWVQEEGLNLTFQGYPDERGLFQTDLTRAPALDAWLEVPGNHKRLLRFCKLTFACANRATVAKILGWMVAAHYKQLFQAVHGKFPLLHVFGQAGLGKCLGIDTPVMMHDGTIKKVQDVVVGDKLLGPDGGVRNVLSLSRGRETLYRIHQPYGQPYVVNESHILSLRNIHTHVVVNLSVRDYEQKDRLWKLDHKGWAVPRILDGEFDFELTRITPEKLDVGDYYGFTLDGDHLFLLGDFTVTHNTEFTTSFLHLFYHNADPVQTTPSSTPFSFISFVGGSASIPVVMDEWKPAMMVKDLAEKYRGIFRDAYNGKETQRGGGSRTIDKFGALNRQPLSAPIVYIAEAAETETAIVERSVMVAFRRAGEIQRNAASAAYGEWAQELEILSVLGRQIAADILTNVTPESFRADFNPMHKWAIEKYRLVPGDDEKLASGELTKAQYDIKVSTKDRPVYNSTVALFGLVVLRRLLQTALGGLFDEKLTESFKLAANELFAFSSSDSVAAQPEYVKVLCVMSDMSRMNLPGGDRWLVDGLDYNLTEVGGKPVLVLAARFSYNKYRQFCRTVGIAPMYPGDSAFELSLREVPGFLQNGVGTATADVHTTILDLEILQRVGVPVFAGKPTTLKK